MKFERLDYYTFIKRFDNEKVKRFCLYTLLFVLILIVCFSFSFAGLNPVKTVYIDSNKLSYENGDEGAFRISKSSQWIGAGKANITFNVNSIANPVTEKLDVILALDTSFSMMGDRLTSIKSEVNELMSYLIGLNTSNKVGLISFNSDATVLSDFTNDINVLREKIDSIIPAGATDYYSAFSATEELLKEYTVEDGRKCVVLIFTDGANSESIPNEVVKASYLKSTYPYITINSILYEMGDIIDEGLASVSNNLFKANKANISSVFYKATVGLETYDNFVIEDIVNSTYFDVVSVLASIGEVSLIEVDDNKKVSWDLGNSYFSGTEESLEIEIQLKDEYLNTGGIYQTNIQELVESTIGENIESITESVTPVIADNYTVSYDGNAPEDCTAVGIPSSRSFSVFSTVEINDEIPVCSGYKFKGWEFDDDLEVTRMGDSYFIMPEADVVLHAEWSRVSIEKSMEGVVLELPLLYDVIASKSVPDNIASDYVSSSTGINFKMFSSSSNGEGVYEFSSTIGDEYPVYYYRGDIDNNNVVFADFCWRAVRTTSTGGVKLVYNGVVDANGDCYNSGGQTTIGNSSFNSVSSVAGAGYMYGDVAVRDTYVVSNWPSLVSGVSIYTASISEVESWYFSDSVSYCSSILSCGIGNWKSYILENPVSFSAIGDYNGIVGKYTNHGLSGGTTRLANAGYIFAVTDTTVYYQTVYEGEIWQESYITIPSFVFAKDVSYNNSTYTLVDTVSVSLDKWSSSYENILANYKYTCLSSSSSCDKVRYIYNADSGNIYCQELINGMTGENFIDEVLENSSNSTDSLVKSFIDNWYSIKLSSYTDQLEDTVWCNDRRVADYGKWGSNSSSSGFLYFLARNRETPTLQCRLNDSFTVSTDNGNGKLTYPVALLTLDEAMLAGYEPSSNRATTYLNNNVSWNLMTPVMFDGSAYVAFIRANGSMNVVNEVATYVRPAISLKYGAKVLSGIGTKDDPYVIVSGNMISILGNPDIVADYTYAPAGKTVTLSSVSGDYQVLSFKLNGNLVEGNSFIMPNVPVKITDIVVAKQVIVESRDINGGTSHNNYPNNANETYEKTFEGATSLTVELTYQTESTSYDWIYLYDSVGATTPVNNKKYGGVVLTTETITIDGNYIKIVFRTDSSANSFYGYKAVIVPNY